MTPPDDHLNSIAEGLSEARKRAVLSLSDRPQDMSVTFSVRHGYALERLGLARRTLLSDRTYLTATGLALRNLILTEGQSK